MVYELILGKEDREESIFADSAFLGSHALLRMVYEVNEILKLSKPNSWEMLEKTNSIVKAALRQIKL